MSTYIILSRFLPDAVEDAKTFMSVEARVSERLRNECPNVKWKARYATFGRFDMVDIVECADPAEVARATMIIRTLGKAVTETMQASEWSTFVQHV